MIPEENTTRWQVGDLVLAKGDAKKPEMLMKVLGYTPEGKCITKYAKPNAMNGDALRIKRRQGQELWMNPIGVLHDPALFNVSVVPVNGGV